MLKLKTAGAITIIKQGTTVSKSGSSTSAQQSLMNDIKDQDTRTEIGQAILDCKTAVKKLVETEFAELLTFCDGMGYPVTYNFGILPKRVAKEKK